MGQFSKTPFSFFMEKTANPAFYLAVSNSLSFSEFLKKKLNIFSSNFGLIFFFFYKMSARLHYKHKFIYYFFVYTSIILPIIKNRPSELLFRDVLTDVTFDSIHQFLLGSEILLFPGFPDRDSIFQFLVEAQGNLPPIHHNIGIILLHILPPNRPLYVRIGCCGSFSYPDTGEQTQHCDMMMAPHKIRQ